MFKRAVGYNAQNDLEDNMVNIINTGNNGVGYYQSYLDMLLDDTPAYFEHNIPNFYGTGKYLMIKVNYIDTTAVPVYVSVTIGLPGAPTPAPINPTQEPVNPLTLAPINPPNLDPINPPTYVTVNPKTPLPTILNTSEPINLTTPMPLNPPTLVPFNLPTYTPVNQLTLVLVNLPTSTTINQPTTSPIKLPKPEPVYPPLHPYSPFWILLIIPH